MVEDKLDDAVDRCVFCKTAWADDTVYRVGLLRKPQGKHPEHAFLVIQGKAPTPRHTPFFKRYDLFFDKKSEKGQACVDWKHYNPRGSN